MQLQPKYQRMCSYMHAVQKDHYTVEPPITDPPTSGQPPYKGH